MSEKTRLMLSGSAGFIGSNFVRKVIYDKQPYEIFSVDKVANSSMLNNIYQHKLHEFYIADICDRHVMDKIFEYVKPDVVVHMAAEASVDKSINDPDIFIRTNVSGTQNLVNLALKYQVSKFVYCSTDEVYGALNSAEDAPWSEDAPLNPKNPYSASKAAGELVVRAAANTHALPFIITRSCNNYGKRQTPDKLIPRSIKCLLEDKPIPVYGKGAQIRDWLHVDDNCNAILRILKYGKVGETYNISGNQELTNLEVVSEICNLMGKDKSYINFIQDPRPGHDFRYGVNSQKLSDLGWRPIYKFKDGLARTVEWFIDNRFFLLNN